MENSKSSLKNRLYEAITIRGKKAADLAKDLDIPKSAVSQYLSGKSQKMDSARLYAIAKYLDVAEPWLLGYDVPMEREAEQNKNSPPNYDGLSEKRKALMQFAMSVPEDKAELILQVMKTILEND